MVDFIKKIPAGMMIVPIFIGILINTFSPSLLKIGNPTEILFTSKGITIWFSSKYKRYNI